MPSTATLNKPVLQVGAQGAEVIELQTLLKSFLRPYHAPISAIDGIYGPTTANSVLVFQFIMFIAPDRIVGDRTWRALFQRTPVDMPDLSVGSQSPLVAKVNRRLSLNSFQSAPDQTTFTSLSKTAVMRFQAAKGLVVDGVVGPQTWHALSKLIMLSEGD
jgi:peptidoglycan hydrolase-like protein with peptidoglycan-binding domain